MDDDEGGNAPAHHEGEICKRILAVAKLTAVTLATAASVLANLAQLSEKWPVLDKIMHWGQQK